jgi:uncharacterized glyoxalase superfamily protein PhnB
MTVRLNPYLRTCWERLSEGGTVLMPFEQAPWGGTFGMCVDRFGTSWMVNATANRRKTTPRREHPEPSRRAPVRVRA